MNILLYGNGGSGNHGCEAIVRGTAAVLGKENNQYIIYSDASEQDRQYGLEKLADIRDARAETGKDLRFAGAYLRMKLLHDYAAMDLLPYLGPIRNAARQTDVALSVGGDNYCYGGTDLYRYLNRAYHDAGMKTVLWGCSIEPSVVEMEKIREDLNRYNLIVARESITFEAVKKVASRVICAPDPAFQMEAMPCEEEKVFRSGDVIGINVSPMIVSNESREGITRENYTALVRYILDHTDSKVALIPHVVWARNDDRKELRRLYEQFAEKERLILVEDHTAPELKGLIARCRAFVGARTHATIAAYSSCVPTLVVGYSVKARGIARDLFGTEENYVLPVQKLEKKNDLTETFEWLLSHESAIRQQLRDMMPAYTARCDQARTAIEGLIR